MLEFFHSTFDYLMDERSLTVHKGRFAEYAAAIHAKGCPLQHIFMFVDGTDLPVCRPGIYQNVLFSGHHWVHSLKYQGLDLPNGIQPFPFGPIAGSNHDSFMLRASGLIPLLHRLSRELGIIYAAYGDLAYPNDPCLLRPTGGSEPWQVAFDSSMSSYRIAVEWGFGKVFTLFAWLDYRHAHSVLLSPVGLIYPVANILANCHTCLYGSQTGSYFSLLPPSLEAYLSGRPL